MTVYKNTPYDDLKIGMEASQTRLCVADDLYVFAHASGNMNPMHLPEQDGDGDGHPEAYAPAAWLGSLISSVFGNRLPGPGTLYKSQSLHFSGRISPGQTVKTCVRLIAKGPNREATFETWVEAPDGSRLVDGIGVVTAPAQAVTFSSEDMPGLLVEKHVHFDRLLESAAPLPPMPTAVVAPESADALAGALLAYEHTLITPILIGNRPLIDAAAEEAGVDISGHEIIDEPHHGSAALRATALVQEGRARAVMKGHLHTHELLRAIVAKEGGLRTDRKLSHVFVFDVPGIPHLVFVTDAAINISPDLKTKIDIVQNAIDLAQALGVAQPKVGILSAVETVNPRIPSTLDAAALSKMAERGQIKGGLVDGPLAMDNAVSLEAAASKGIKGLVAGRADVLVAPNLEAGNMIAKQLTFMAHAEAGGVVIGASVPIVLTSRADDEKARLASCAIAALFAAHLP